MQLDRVTRDYSLRRLRIFFNHINLEPDLTIEERCNSFAKDNLDKFSFILDT